jgi:hypothetical protein
MKLALEKIINNYINGNLTDAKNGAKRTNIRALKDYMQEYYGYSVNKATMIALYLKGEATFKDACNAE